MASNRYAPEGSYDPYRGGDETGWYGAYDGYGSAQPQQGYGSCAPYERYDPYAPYERYAPYQSCGQQDAHAYQPYQTYAPYDGGYADPYGGPQGDGYGALYDLRTEGNGPYDYDAQWQQPEAASYEYGTGYDSRPDLDGGYAQSASLTETSTDFDLQPWYEWNPTEESVAPVQGRHRVAKQRRRGMARSGAVLGVGMIAAVSAGGLASAKAKDPASISIPDLAAASHKLPGVGHLLPGGDKPSGDATTANQAPLTQAIVSKQDTAAGRTDAGEAMRNRIMAQAKQQKADADAAARAAAAKHAAEKKHKEEAARKRKAEAEKRAKAEAARLAKLAKSFKLPVASYTLTAGFGEGGSLWQNNHTGQDFAAPNGTPIKSVHGGTVTEAGWAGSYGYRTVVKMDDGTELWYCHQSSMSVSKGDKVTTGQVIGRVGSTGNVTGPHLHLEVRPGGGDPIDPMPWLRSKGLHP